MNAGERYYRIDGVRMKVRDVGEGRPILLINGLGGHTSMWAPLESHLPGRRVISFDAPGLGDSGTVWPPPTIGMAADLVAHLLDALGIDETDVLGYSFGGAVAQQLAFTHRGRVRRLVLGATLPGWGAVMGETRSMALAWNPLRYYSRSFYDRTIGTLAGGQARDDLEFRAHHVNERLSGQPRWLAFYGQIMALSTWTSLAWLERIEAPTLVLTGDDDPLVPMANSYLLARRIRRARLVVAPGEGHLLLFDVRTAAASHIQEFLDAPDFADSATWRNGLRVTDAELSEILRASRSGPWPWGQLSAMSRRWVSPSGAVT